MVKLSRLLQNGLQAAVVGGCLENQRFHEDIYPIAKKREEANLGRLGHGIAVKERQSQWIESEKHTAIFVKSGSWEVPKGEKTALLLTEIAVSEQIIRANFANKWELGVLATKNVFEQCCETAALLQRSLWQYLWLLSTNWEHNKAETTFGLLSAFRCSGSLPQSTQNLPAIVLTINIGTTLR